MQLLEVQYNLSIRGQGRGHVRSVSMRDNQGRGTRRDHSLSSATTSTSAVSVSATTLGTETVGISTSVRLGMSTFADPQTSTFPITQTNSSSSPGPSIKLPRTSHSPGLSLKSQPHTPIISSSDSDVGSNYMGSRKRLRVYDGSFVESHEISSRISRIFKERLHQDGYRWKAVPQEVRDIYWGEFQKYYEWEDVCNGIIKTLWEQLAGKRYSNMLHCWKKRGKPAFVSNEVWQSWQHWWNDVSFKSIRERQLRNRHSDIDRPRSGISRHGCGSISLAKHEMKYGAPSSKIQELNAMECQDEFGNQVPVSKKDEDRMLLQVVEASSHSICMHRTGQNKSSSFASDSSASIGPLEAAHQRIRELELVQSRLREEVRELRSNIQSSNEWRLQTEEVMRCMMKKMMEEKERFRVSQLPPNGPSTD